MALFVGTSGWAYKEWKGAFYPQRLPQARFLDHYAHVLGACEVNTTFYGPQPEEVVASWRDATPAGFRFAVKAQRRLTHTKRLEVKEPWLDLAETFFTSIAPLGDRLGCVLLQFPPHLERDDTALDNLLEALEGKPPLALEFRHESWQKGEVTERVAAAGATVCLSDTEGDVPAKLPPGQLAYVRMRAERYSESQRDGWLALLEREAGRRDVYAFARHRDVPAGDPFTGVGLAEWLTERAEAKSL